jgi:hypothetical protein
MSTTVPASRIRRLLASVLGCLLLAGAAPVVAGAACPVSPTTESFAQFGDGSSYSLAPGGSFEAALPGWSLGKASVAAGNESYNVVGGSHSLALPAGGVVYSPWICISSEYPSFRFFARRTGGSTAASLGADLQWLNVLGLGVDTPAGSVAGTASWEPSPVMRLGNSIPLWLPGSVSYVRLVFRAGDTASWAIDDVLIDPYNR